MRVMKILNRLCVAGVVLFSPFLLASGNARERVHQSYDMHKEAFNGYVLLLYKDYKDKEFQCIDQYTSKRVTQEELKVLRGLDSRDVSAYAIRKGIDHKVACTARELVLFLHAGWAAHRVSKYDKNINSADHLMNDVVDYRYVDSVYHLGSVSRDIMRKLDGIEYFKEPFDIEVRPWE